MALNYGGSSMTLRKQVARTLTTVLEHPLMEEIAQRRHPVTEASIRTITSWWGMDMYSRNPSPALMEEGLVRPTDLDLACALHTLMDRRAVISLPTYIPLRKSRLREGEQIVSKENRHGNIIGLVADQETLTNSVTIKDANVMTTDSVGVPRNYSLTGFDGEFYEGWRRLNFLPTAQENSFLSEKRLWTGSTVVFRHFASPNRWTGLFGQYYFITKALIQRLTEESAFLFQQIKAMKLAGISYPPADEPRAWPETYDAPGASSKKIMARAFVVEVDYPLVDEDFPEFVHSPESLVTATKLRNYYLNHVIPRLRFATRATELSFLKNGENKFPGWLKNCEWQSGYRQKRKRTDWDRLVLFQPGVGELGVSLRKREYEKTEHVAANYRDSKVASYA